MEDLALGSGEWFLRGAENTFRINMSYDSSAAKAVFRDFKPTFERVTALSQPAILLFEFLEQFHEVNDRWMNCYSEFIADFLWECAIFQKKLLSRRSAMSADVSDESILIALSLRCLVLTHELFRVDVSLGGRAFENNETHYQLERLYDEDLWIETSRLPSASQAVLVDSKQKAPDSLSSILQGILQITQRLMFRRKPEDWPLLLCTLCLMRLIRDNLSPVSYCMGSLKPASQAMHKAFSILCRLYDICAKGFHPFSNKWKREGYAALVENDEVLVGHSQRLHEMWLEGEPYQQDFAIKEQ